MAQVRIFNPSLSYTPREYFAGREKGAITVAKHHKHYRRHHRRHNPFGISSGVIKDAAYNAAGALGALALAGMFPSFSTGWAGVAATGAATVAASFAGRAVVGAKEAEEILKGSLTATIIRAVHQAGVFKSITLGSYVRSYFTVPTSSDAYGRAAFPALPAAKGVSGLGYHRFRSRYAGNYGGV